MLEVDSRFWGWDKVVDLLNESMEWLVEFLGDVDGVLGLVVAGGDVVELDVLSTLALETFPFALFSPPPFHEGVGLDFENVNGISFDKGFQLWYIIVAFVPVVWAFGAEVAVADAHV